jgi:hypothetical protein
MRPLSVGVTTFAVLSLLSCGAGCSHEAQSGPSSSTSGEVASSLPTTTTSPPTLGTGGHPLYGDYVRPEFGLIKKRALRHHSDEWSVVFPEPGAWKGVVTIVYWGQKKPLGHAYAYQASKDGSLRLGPETRAPRRSFPVLEGGGFACTRSPALYAWARSSNYELLRLTPMQDRCAVRRRILSAEWTFID